MLERRKRAARLLAFIRNHAARVIQKYYRLSVFPFIRAATLIQKIYRGRRGKRKVKIIRKSNIAATVIQKVMRGVLVRVSDRYILAQIYLKLPPFWRVIMNSAPKHNANMEAARRRIFPYQITDLQKDTRGMMTHILNETVEDGVLAPKMPYVVPQPFDKNPYVSLQDGRKMAFYSHKEGLLAIDTGATTTRALERTEKKRRRIRYDKDGNDVNRMAAAAARSRRQGAQVDMQGSDLLSSLAGGDRIPMHCFNVTFWPHTAPIDLGDPSTEQHDPMLNGFEVAQNSRQALYCEGEWENGIWEGKKEF